MDRNELHQDIITAAIRIGLLFVLLWVCFQIVRPFIVLIVWGAIIATALHPLHQFLTARWNGAHKRSAVVITLIALAVVIVPSYLLGGSLIDTAQTIGTELEDGSFEIPPPADSVAEWPLIGERLHSQWSAASNNIEDFTRRHEETIKNISGQMLKAAAAAFTATLGFIFSIIIAGVLLNFAEGCRDSLLRLFGKITPTNAESLVRNSAATVQSVAKGILGTAFIQSTLCTLGMVVVGVPGVGLWAILCLLLAIAQLPPILVLFPVALYVFKVEPAWIAWIFLIYSILASGSDTVLKPMLLGRGVELPMLVILIGALGGMILAGIVGLFTGAVFLAVLYQLYMRWIEDDLTRDTASEA